MKPAAGGKLSFRLPLVAGLLVLLGALLAMVTAINLTRRAQLQTATRDVATGAETIIDNLAQGMPLGDSDALVEGQVSWALYNSSGDVITVGRITGGVVRLEEVDGVQLPVVRGRGDTAATSAADVEVLGGRIVTATRQSVVNGETFKVVAVTVIDQDQTVQLILARNALWWSPALAAIEMVVVYVAVRGLLASVREIGETTTEIAEIGDLDQRVYVENKNDELGQLAAMFNEMLARLEASGERQKQFISDASHELRSPLTSITNTLETLKGGKVAFDATMLNLLWDESQRLNRIVTDLLVLARSEHRARQVIEVDVDDVVLTMAERVRGAGKHCEVDLMPARVEADVSDVESVVGNLVANAMRHSNTTVRLALSGGDSGMTLIVEDDGNGIAPEDRDSIFERFVRLDESRSRDAGGSGLGLAVVKRVVDSYGGTVRVDNGNLGGARFTVTWPPVATAKERRPAGRRVRVTHKSDGDAGS